MFVVEQRCLDHGNVHNLSRLRRPTGRKQCFGLDNGSRSRSRNIHVHIHIILTGRRRWCERHGGPTNLQPGTRFRIGRTTSWSESAITPKVHVALRSIVHGTSRWYRWGLPHLVSIVPVCVVVDQGMLIRRTNIVTKIGVLVCKTWVF
jgi:hypothetical protein